ncbi:MAG: type II secretion system F family protein [Rhodospirillales bacterium]|nr:type II secretion system F family protein [Rhodospirillales bacterium]
MTPVVLASAAIALMLAVAGAGVTLLLVAGRRRQAVLDRRIERIVAVLPGHATARAGPSEESVILQSRRDRFRLWGWIEARYPLLHVPTALPVAAGLGLAGGGAVSAAAWFLQVPFGWWTPPLFAASASVAACLSLAWLQKRLLNAFIAKFPELVDQIVRLSATGVPVIEAIASVTEHAPHPVKPVLAMFTDYLAAGLDPEEAAGTVSRRFRIPELIMFLAVVRLQRRSGGGVSAAFANLSKTLRDRRQASLKAKASTAQTRFTLLILAVLPFVLLGVQSFTSPDSVAILFDTDTGTQLLRWGFALIAGGLYIARTIASNAAR